MKHIADSHALRLLLLGPLLAGDASGTTATRPTSTFARRALHDLEHGGNETAEMGALIVDRIVRAHLKTMARLNIGYDLLTYEGDILRLKFWAHCLRHPQGAGRRVSADGRQAGRLLGHAHRRRASDAEQADSRRPEKDEESREKVIVRSNGVVTYVGKDIANQFWKFGLLGRDFHYHRFAEQADGHTLWATTSADGETSGVPAFGGASRIYNVIDSRQMYLQALLSQALRTLGHPEQAENSIHFSYEMVALSHETAQELGYPPEPDEEQKPFVEVSGRKGLGRQNRRPARRARGQGERPKCAAQSRVHAGRVPGVSRRRLPSRRSATSCSSSRAAS